MKERREENEKKINDAQNSLFESKKELTSEKQRYNKNYIFVQFTYLFY